MGLVKLPLTWIRCADWNPNRMDSVMRTRLLISIERFGPVVPPVVRKVGPGTYETVGGAQRLDVLREMGFDSVVCWEVDADDTEARLLAQALNHIAGQDDPGLRAEALRSILESVPQEVVLALLPETAESLGELVSLGEEDLAQRLRAWQTAQSARLKHLTFQLTEDELPVVRRALESSMTDVTIAPDEVRNPNRRGNALFHLCRAYLEQVGAYTPEYRHPDVQEPG